MRHRAPRQKNPCLPPVKSFLSEIFPMPGPMRNCAATLGVNFPWFRPKSPGSVGEGDGLGDLDSSNFQQKPRPKRPSKNFTVPRPGAAKLSYVWRDPKKAATLQTEQAPQPRIRPTWLRKSLRKPP